MSQSFSEEKPPRKPVEYGNLVICKEDFEKYKKFLEHKPEKYNKDLTHRLLREFNVDKTFIQFHDKFHSEFFYQNIFLVCELIYALQLI